MRTTPAHSSSCFEAAARSRQDDAVELGLEPLDAIVLLEAMRKANLAPTELPVLHPHAWPCQVHVEVHSVDARAGVVLDAKVNVLRDAEAKAAVLCEVPLPQLVLLDFQSLLQDFLRLLAADGHMAGNLLVTADSKGSDGHPCLRENRLLLSELLKHLCCAGEAISTLAHTDVQRQLLDLDLPHGVVRLVRHRAWSQPRAVLLLCLLPQALEPKWLRK
mmetsp:Transcript_17067/g.37459  ORF Transcript_17067/g.37459 Transcript_17067/m.37459 type:complete len:218 (-) Transcript_17067:5-658(-)